MTREETKKILRIVIATYPNFKTDNISDTLDAWHFFLADHDYNRIAVALKTYVNVSNSAFPPSASQLIGLTFKASEMAKLDATEAWQMVRKAIGRSNYYAEEEFEKFPDLVKSCVGSPSQLRNWAVMESETIDSVVASNFAKTFNARQKSSEEYQRLPVEMRLQVDAAKEKVGIGSKDEDWTD